MNVHSSHLSPNTITTVLDAVKSLMGKKPRFGLPAPVSSCKVAHEGTVWGGKRIHLWITVAGNMIGLRIFEHASRPKRRVLRDLLSKCDPPTLIVYEHMRPCRIEHKVAQCIKTGLNRLRLGFISLLRPARDQGLIEKCDCGNNLSVGFRSTPLLTC